DWCANTARPPLPPRVRLPTAIVFEWTAMPSCPVVGSRPMIENVPSSPGSYCCAGMPGASSTISSPTPASLVFMSLRDGEIVDVHFEQVVHADAVDAVGLR